MIAVVDFNGLAWKLLECYLICPLARLPLHHDPCHHGALAADLITAGETAPVPMRRRLRFLRRHPVPNARGDLSHSLSKSTSGPCLVSTPLTHHRVCFLLLVLCTVSRPSRSSWLFPCQSEHKLADSASWELYVRIFESTKNTHTEATRFLILIRSPPIPRTTPSPRSLAHIRAFAEHWTLTPASVIQYG